MANCVASPVFAREAMAGLADGVARERVVRDVVAAEGTDSTEFEVAVRLRDMLPVRPKERSLPALPQFLNEGRKRLCCVNLSHSRYSHGLTSLFKLIGNRVQSRKGRGWFVYNCLPGIGLRKPKSRVRIVMSTTLDGDTHDYMTIHAVQND